MADAPAPSGVRLAECPAGPAWHALGPVAVLGRLRAGPAGLSAGEHARRYAQYGPNVAAERKRDSVWEELFESVTEPLQLLLVAVGVLSAIFGELSDAAAIFVVIVLVAVTETVTELRASRRSTR